MAAAVLAQVVVLVAGRCLGSCVGGVAVALVLLDLGVFCVVV